MVFIILPHPAMGKTRSRRSGDGAHDVINKSIAMTAIFAGIIQLRDHAIFFLIDITEIR
jgi:hypothetical protein